MKKYIFICILIFIFLFIGFYNFLIMFELFINYSINRFDYCCIILNSYCLCGLAVSLPDYYLPLKRRCNSL